MDIKQLLENKVLLVVILLVVGFFSLNIIGPKVVDFFADKVIEKLQRDYTPGPYTPGVDPDKVPSDLWTKPA